jgi:phosphoribosyl-ATP pyrophosphohydrolase
MGNFAAVLEQLWSTVEARRRAPSDTSWTAKLMADPALAAKKLAEEAVETALAAVQGDRAGVVAESADLIYHWLALLAALGVTPDEVAAELAARQGRSGLEEKAGR